MPFCNEWRLSGRLGCGADEVGMRNRKGTNNSNGAILCENYRVSISVRFANELLRTDKYFLGNTEGPEKQDIWSPRS